MVKVYLPIRENLNEQELEILDWLNNSEIFKRDILLCEFKVPIYPKRQVDLILLHSDRIFLIEVKGETFTQISEHKQWKYINPKTDNEEDYYGQFRGEPENPYQQATSAANNFCKYLQTQIDDFTTDNALKAMVNSKSFTVFPIVFISDRGQLEESDIKRELWCKLAIGTKDLGILLQRTLKKRVNNFVEMNPPFFEEITFDLDLEELDKSRQGGENAVLNQILLYLIENPQEIKTIEQLRDSVPFPPKVRPISVKKAVKKGKKLGMITNQKGYIILSDLFNFMLNIYHNFLILRKKWNKLSRIRKLAITNSKLFKHYIDFYSTTQQPSTSLILEEFSDDIVENISDILQPYNFNDFIAFQEELEPEFFRLNGCLWIDIIKGYVLPFQLTNGDYLETEIKSSLENMQNCLIVGSPSSGKSTLVRMLGVNFLTLKIPVIIFDIEDLDRDISAQIERFEQKNEGTNHKLLIIIENLHLATTQEILIVQKFFTPYQNVIFLFTSRGKQLILGEENLFDYFNDSQWAKYYDLDIVIDKKFHYQSILEKIIKEKIHQLERSQRKEIIENIIERNHTLTELLQIEVEVIAQYLKEGTSLTILSDKAKHLQNIDSYILTKINTFIEKITKETKINSNHIQLVLYVLYLSTVEELPLSNEFFNSLTSIDEQDIYDILDYLDENEEIYLDDSNKTSIHPLYAEKIISVLSSNDSGWKNIEDILLSNFTDIPGTSLSEKLRNFIFQLEPDLQANWKDSDGYLTINYDIFAKLSIKGWIEYYNKIPLANFVNLLRNTHYYSNKFTSMKYWELWETIGIDNLYSDLSQEDLDTMCYFLEEIYSSKWTQFPALLGLFTPIFFFSKVTEDGYVDFHHILEYLHKWNYPWLVFLEIEFILRHFRKEIPETHYPYYEISKITLEELDNIDAHKLIKDLQQNDKLNLGGFLRFLNDASQRVKHTSKLRINILKLILEDALEHISMEYLGTALMYLSPTSIVQPPFNSIIDKWNIKSMYNTIRTKYPKWLRFFIGIFPQNSNIQNKVLDLLQITNLKEIFENPELYLDSPEELPFEYEIDFLHTLQTNEWSKLSKYLDSNGADYYISNIQQSPELNHTYKDNILMKILLETEWTEKTMFIQEFDFLGWCSSKELYEITNLLPNFYQNEISQLNDILKYFFTEKIEKQDYYSFKQIFVLYSSFSLDWRADIDWNILNEGLNKDIVRGKQVIKILRENGLEIPSNINSLIKVKSEVSETTFLEGLSLIDRFHECTFALRNHNKAIELLKTILNDDEYTTDFNIMPSILEKLSRFSEEEQNLIFREISLEKFIQFMPNIKDFRQFVPRFLDLLKRIDFPDMNLVSFSLIQNSHIPLLDLIFSYIIKIQNHFDIEKLIFQLLKVKEYEKLNLILRSNSKLAPVLFKLSLDEIISQKPDNGFLWQLYMNSMKKISSISEEQFIQNIIELFVQLGSLKYLLSVYEKQYFLVKLPKFCDQFVKIESKIQKQLLTSTPLITLGIIFQLLNSDNLHDHTILLIQSLSEKEWCNKIKKTKLKNPDYIIFWVAKVYPNITKQFELDKNSLFLKFL